MITEFVGNLFCPPEPGHIFIFSGKTLDAASRLDIDFLTSKIENTDCLLHISVLFRKEQVIRNSRFGNQWQENEIMENVDPMAPLTPLVAGARFRIYILVSDDRFRIAFNDINYCSFNFRGPLNEIRTLRISKDVQFVSQVDHRCFYPSPFPLIHLNHDDLSFSNDVPKKFTPGHAIIITAIPFGNPKGRFTMSFYEKETKQQALHLNPRFEQRVVVRNSTNQNLKFRDEETSGEFPFTFDQQFKLAIGLSKTHFLIAIDGKRFCMYKYRRDNQLDLLYGFKLFCIDGLRLEIQCLDHIYTGSPTCLDFEAFSNPDVELY